MKGTYSSEQANPNAYYSLMNHFSSIQFQSYIQHNQFGFPGSLTQSPTIPSLFPSQDFHPNNINNINASLVFSFAGMSNNSYYDQLISLELSKHNSFSSMPTSNNTFDHNKFASSNFSSYGQETFTTMASEYQNSFSNHQLTVNSQRDFEGYYQVLKIMPFRDDEPVPKFTPQQNLESHLNLSIQTETSDQYLDINKAHSIPVKVTLEVSSMEICSRPPLDIVCVVEKGQEMVSGFFEAVRNSLYSLLNALTDRDRLSLVFYDDFGYRTAALNRMTEQNKDIIRNALSNVYLGGGADLVDGLGQAMELLRQRKYSNPTACVLVLGVTKELKAAESLDFLLQKYSNENFYIHSFGCGENNQLLQWVAERKNGAFHQIKDENNLTISIFEALDSVSRIQSHEAELYFFTNTQLKPENSILQAYNQNFTWSIPEKCYKVKLPYLTPGFKEEFRLEVAIPKLRDSLKTGEQIYNALDVIYRVETLDTVLMKKENLQLTLCNDTNDESTADQEQGEEQTFDDDLTSYHQGFYANQAVSPSIASIEKVNKLIIVEELMLEANKLLQQNQAEEAKKIASRLRWEAQGLGMEFEVVIKNFLEKVYQSCYKESFDDY